MNELTLYTELPNGIKLYTNSITKTTEKYAQSKGINNARIFIAMNKEYKTFLLVIGDQPEYENQSLESVGARIDMIALSNER